METPVTTEHQSLASARWKIAISLTAVVIVLYFGFIALIAFEKPLMGTRLAPGLSVGILLGSVVIVASWCLTWIYVRWANRHYDERLDALKRSVR
jgi:uncharacterized membrane protein (DUF485 family)